MPKEIVSLRDLTGGLNTFANPRNIEDNQYIEGINLDTGVLGTVRIAGGFSQLYDVSSGAVARDAPVNLGGYGIGTYQVDRQLDDPAVAGQFSIIAVYKPASTSSYVGLLQIPTSDTPAHITNLMSLASAEVRRNASDTDAGAGGDNSKISYLVIDGQLVVYGDAAEGLSNNTHCFDPQILKYVEAGQKFFVNSGALDEVTTDASYTQKKFFVEAPAGGNTKISTSTDVSAIWDTVDYDWDIDDDKVGLIVHEYSQTSSDHQGWGKEPDESQLYNFYASYIYDGTNESMATSIGSASLGGHEDDSGEFNDVTFYAVVRARATATDGAFQWDPTITSIKIYYNKADKDQDIKYYIGEFPVRSYSASEYVCEEIGSNSNANRGFAILYGDKTGKGDASWTGKGIYHYEPPRVFTHAVNSGIRGDTKSTICRFKTGVILNRKLYVGGVYQKTKDSPNAPKEYPDRLLKSISNRFGVLPDTEFVDVAIRDGEDIIRLAGIGNMLMQFKQNTLYVISVAGGEEYLSGTYKNMGVRHPNAVVQFEGGVFWVNEFGAYIFAGNEAPINVIQEKIGLGEWKDFVTDETIVGYDPRNKKFFVCKDSTNLLDDSDTDNPEPAEFYVFNMTTGSWNKHMQTIGEGYFSSGIYTETDQARSGISNFITFSKPSGEKFMAVHLGYGDGSNLGLLQHFDVEKTAQYPFNLLTKEFTSGNAHQRKSIYAVYITYKGTMTGDNDPTGGTDYIVPKVSLICQNAGNTITTTTLEPKSAGLGFSDASDWETAHYVVPNSDKADTRNAYGIQLLLEPGTGSLAINNDFEISDVSFILRLKSIK